MPWTEPRLFGHDHRVYETKLPTQRRVRKGQGQLRSYWRRWLHHANLHRPVLTAADWNSDVRDQVVDPLEDRVAALEMQRDFAVGR